MTVKLAGWVALALVVMFGAGWLLGSSGRSGADQERRRVEERAGFLEARAHVLDGRVSLFLVNFGDASRRFEEARTVLARVQSRLREVGEAERAGRLEIALSHLRDAQRLASSLDASAQAAATAALDAIDAAAPPPGASAAAVDATSGSSR